MAKNNFRNRNRTRRGRGRGRGRNWRIWRGISYWLIFYSLCNKVEYLNMDVIKKTKRDIKLNGGAREGAGRPVSKSTLIAQKIKEIMAVELNKRFKPILEAQLDSAQGIQTEHYDRKTNKLYYQEREPNTNAFKHLVDHVIGRPKESLGIENLDNQPFIIKLDRW